MLEDNIKIIGTKGEYKDFPYRKELYLYDKCVYVDDFAEDISPADLIVEFGNALLEAVGGVKEEKKGELDG